MLTTAYVSALLPKDEKAGSVNDQVVDSYVTTVDSKK